MPNEKPVENVPRLAGILESNLEAHGIISRVSEINYHPHHLEFQLEIGQGTPLSKFEELSRDIALFLASPTGKVELALPIPGTHRIGINLPRRTKENAQTEIPSKPIEMIANEKNVMYFVRNFLADILFLISSASYNLATKLHINAEVLKPLIASPKKE